jgi:anhydro-N-acetylmuramic acid kinase
MTERYIGLMSGTSLDGVDGVLAECSDAAGAFKVIAHAYAPFPDALRHTFLALNTPSFDELHHAALAGNALARAYAEVVASLLSQTGFAAHYIKAIGAHGQTVRHRPQEFDNGPTLSGGYTVQLNNPSLLAELTGIDVVADFRTRDVAAGGQGAPLVPAFHQSAFGKPDQAVAVLNIGGISNITLIAPTNPVASDDVVGFDCGPGNALMDYWCQKHLGQAFDAGGHWAATGQVNQDLLAVLLDEPYFGKAPPKSTGRDLFNPAWLQSRLAGFEALKAVDVQVTLVELTVSPCVDSIVSYINYSNQQINELIVCGGGALNTHLMSRLQARLQDLVPGLLVVSSQDRGLPPLQVEAAAFAWLARKTIHRETGSLPKVTGAQGARILGAIYPA